MVSIKTFLVLVTLTVACVSAEDCAKFFKVDPKTPQVVESCTKELNLDPNPAPKTEDQFKKDYDDKV